MRVLRLPGSWKQKAQFSWFRVFLMHFMEMVKGADQTIHTLTSQKWPIVLSILHHLFWQGLYALKSVGLNPKWIWKDWHHCSSIQCVFLWDIFIRSRLTALNVSHIVCVQGNDACLKTQTYTFDIYNNKGNVLVLEQGIHVAINVAINVTVHARAFSPVSPANTQLETPAIGTMKINRHFGQPSVFTFYIFG